MEKTAVVITGFRGNQEITLEEITSLDIINTGTSIFEVNGLKVTLNERIPLVVPDGTYSDVKLSVLYQNNDLSGNRFTIIYKKLKC